MLPSTSCHDTFRRPAARVCTCAWLCLFALRRAPRGAQDHHLTRLRRCSRYIAQSAVALYSRNKSSSALWRPRPKLHMLLELLEYTCVWHMRNPRSFMCYIDEDSMRRAARVAGSCHVRSVGTTALRKVLLNLTLRWSGSSATS